VVFVDGAGVKRTLDVVTAPFGLVASEVSATALSVEILDDASSPTGVSFYVMHPVLCMESRVHNVVGLPDAYDNEHGRSQLRASILIARDFVRDLLDELIDAEDAVRATIKLNERISPVLVSAIVTRRSSFVRAESTRPWRSTTTRGSPRRSARGGCRRCENSWRHARGSRGRASPARVFAVPAFVCLKQPSGYRAPRARASSRFTTGAPASRRA
jgi:hypothetical protein